MSDTGFSKYETKVLLTTRDNLLKGLDEVAKSLAAKTFKKTGPKGEASPSQSGQLTLGLLLKVQEELTKRGYPLTW